MKKYHIEKFIVLKLANTYVNTEEKEFKMWTTIYIHTYIKSAVKQ